MTTRFELRAPEAHHDGQALVLLEWTAREGDIVDPGAPLGFLVSSSGILAITSDRVAMVEDLLVLGGDHVEPGEVIAVLTAKTSG